MTEPAVSVFRNIKQTTGGDDFTLAEVMEAIQAGTWKDTIERYRSMTTNSEEAINAKKKAKREKIPYFTGSGTFRKREDDGLVRHNGRIVLDLDGTSSEDARRMKELVTADPYTEYCFTSTGGDGVAVLIKIDPDRHSESFAALKAYYKNRFNLEVDKGVRDISRARFVSFDPDLFHNPKAKKFIVGRDYEAHVKKVTEGMIVNAVSGTVHETLIRASGLMGGYIAGGLIDEETGFNHLVDVMRTKEGVEDIEIEKKKIRDGINHGKTKPVTASSLKKSEAKQEKDREVFAEIYTFANVINRAGRHWNEHDIVMLCEKYCERVELTKAQVEAVFKKVFSENEDEFGLDDKPDIVKVEVFLAKNYDFARNVVTQLTEFKLKGLEEWEKVNENTIFRHLQHAGFKFSFDKLKSLLKSDFVGEFNPFEDYFNGLAPWDGKVDHITKLAEFVTVADQDFYLSQFKKHLVRAVGCALYGVENRIVFVFVGEKQETGKSTFIRFLSPFGDKYYTEAPIRNDKDSSFSFSENFLYNIEELSSLSNIEVNRLKAIISAKTIKERKAYATNAEEQPRRCTFIGSTNKKEFLVDSENTRWLGFDVLRIDWGYKKEIDINLVWSQAFALWHDKTFNSNLTIAEAAARDLKNKDYEIADLEKELLKKLFAVPRQGTGDFVSNADILRIMLSQWEGSSSHINGRFIGKSMVQLGFENSTKKLNGHTVRGYHVKKILGSGMYEDIEKSLFEDEKTAKGYIDPPDVPF